MKKIKNIYLMLIHPQHLTLGLLCAMITVSATIASEKSMPIPTAKDKCPVCGMFVTKYPDWMIAIRFQNGSYIYFDGAKHMFKFLYAPSKYAQVRAEDIREIFIRDYYSLKWLNARNVWYVVGSDIYGPMGRELIPLQCEADAREFANDHRGKKILKYFEINPDIIRSLD